MNFKKTVNELRKVISKNLTNDTKADEILNTVYSFSFFCLQSIGTDIELYKRLTKETADFFKERAEKAEEEFNQD